MQLVTSIVFTFSSNVFDIETLKKSLPKVLNWRVNWPYLNSLVYESLLLIYSKYFAVFVWLKSPGWSFMTNWGWPNLEDWSSLIDGIVTWKRDCLGFISWINLVSRRGRPAVYSQVNQKNGVHGYQGKEEIAEFQTETERRNCEDTQNILLDGCYLLFK